MGPQWSLLGSAWGATGRMRAAMVWPPRIRGGEGGVRGMQARVRPDHIAERCNNFGSPLSIPLLEFTCGAPFCISILDVPLGSPLRKLVADATGNAVEPPPPRLPLRRSFLEVSSGSPFWRSLLGSPLEIHLRCSFWIVNVYIPFEGNI